MNVEKGPISKESESSPVYDAALIHGYWLSDKSVKDNDGPTIQRTGLSLRSRLATRAASLLYDGGKGIGKIVLTAGHIWGKEYPSVAELMIQELTEKYHLPANAIIVEPNALNTSTEIDIFLKFAKLNGWTKLADLAALKHHWTIPNLYKEKGAVAQPEDIEDILGEKDNSRVRKLVKRLSNSQYERNYALYQTAIKVVNIIDPGYKHYLGKKANEQRTRKRPFGLTPLLPIDVYSLEE